MTKKRLARILRMASKQDLSYGVCSALSKKVSSSESTDVKWFLFEYFANPRLASDFFSYWLNTRVSEDCINVSYRKQLLLDAADFVEATGIVE